MSSAEPRAPTEDLSAPATQIVRDRDDYLGQSRDVGRRLTDEQFELFVGGEPVQALQREFERLAPQYIALHDVGTSSSLRLLATMARSSGSKVMRLSVRRQGHGMALATLQFVEITAADGSLIRAYSTDIDADTQSRQQMARMLLAHAELGVLIVGELPPHVLKTTTQPLLDSAAHDKWPCRELLVVPLGATVPLAALGAGFSACGINTQVTPQSTRSNDAWSFIGGAWNRLRNKASQPAAAHAHSPVHAPSPVHLQLQPLVPPHPGPQLVPSPAQFAAARAAASEPDTRRMPLPAAPAHAPAYDGPQWSEYVHRCASIMGVIGCCVFDRVGNRVLANSGVRPPAEALRGAAERLLAASAEANALLGTSGDLVEAQLSFAGHHLMLRSLPRHAGVVVHVLLDGRAGNLPLARVQLQRLDPP